MPDCGNLRSTKRREVLKRVNCYQALIESHNNFEAEQKRQIGISREVERELRGTIARLESKKSKNDTALTENQWRAEDLGRENIAQRKQIEELTHKLSHERKMAGAWKD